LKIRGFLKDEQGLEKAKEGKERGRLRKKEKAVLHGGSRWNIGGVMEGRAIRRGRA